MQRVIIQIGMKTLLCLEKFEKYVNVISALKSEEIVGTFYEKELQKIKII